MRKKIRPRHSEKSNTNIKILAEETAEQMRGVENFIPPTPEMKPTQVHPELPPVMPIFPEEISTNGPTPSIPLPEGWHPEPLVQPFIFTSGFIDSALALCFCGCLTCVGIIIGLNIK